VKGAIEAIANITPRYSESVEEDVKELYYTRESGKNILVCLTAMSVSSVAMTGLMFVMDTGVYSARAQAAVGY